MSISSQPRRTSARRDRRDGDLCAALDLGTNNCRLLIARPDGDGFHIVDAFSRIVRLGEGVEETGRLSETAMRRSIEALKVCAAKIRRRGVKRGRYVGTAACRNAANCQEFLDRVAAATGLAIETIAAEEEARLTVAGCLPLVDPETPRALVFDIGGGSTELMWLRVGDSDVEIIDVISLPFGVVSLTERFGSGPFEAESYDEMVAVLHDWIAPFCDRHGIAERVRGAGVQMLGSSGTVTTLVGVSKRLRRYDRARVDGAFLGFEVVHGLAGELRAMTPADRAAYPCIGRERADMMAAGCAILEAICRRWPVGRLRVADRGVREGILVDLMGRGRSVAALGNG